LPKLGQAIERARKAKGLTQAELSQRLEGLGLGRTSKHSTPGQGPGKLQSFIARLEGGKITDPARDILHGISTELELPYEALIGLLIQEKYSLGAPTIAPLMRSPKTLEALAQWEGQHTEIWIVATTFVDNHQSRFREAVQRVIKKKDGSVTFFIPRNRADEAFDEYRRRTLVQCGRSSDDPALLAVPLDRKQSALMAASYVVANPGSAEQVDEEGAPQLDGYLILNDEFGEPQLALQMSKTELLPRVAALADFREAHLAKQANESLTQSESEKISYLKRT